VLEPVSASPPPESHFQQSVTTPSTGADVTGIPGSSAPHIDPISASFTPDTFGDLDTGSILDIPEQIGYLKHLGLDFGWGPTAMCEWLLEHIYIYTGLPWWGAIAVAAVGFRVVMFWPSMTGAKHGARMAILQKNPEFVKANAEVKQLMWQADQDPMEIMKARGKISRMTKQAGVSMAKTILAPIAIVPFSFGMFRLLRGMTALPVPSLETGGFAWIMDLTVYDPTYMLPLATAALSAITLRQHQVANLNPTPASEAISKFMMLGMTPIMILCTMWFPAGVQWFFFSFALSSVVQSSVVLLPAVRRLFELPPLSSRTPITPVVAPTVGGQYQAPSRGIRGLLDGANRNIEGLTSGIKEYTGGDEKAASKKAQEYEKKRAQEEKDKALNRMIEHRQKKMRNQNRS
jgi:YidC/Oxa1 family membrane protein insertase